ncbi:DNA polymerase III subunit delta' [Anaerotalea alkaliphila]|uniref:DNA polymerase III subunit delta' n=1 Tax=Anaerotalea alkaliphila TaxID=2662126 RepID=A0A7X5HW28_9FIRM|nr:DNA polymerase III subunit delta' [Anaerotalea alkaliphila]NDL67733.1 DNA polymerase III subunit delta' [Anaerotalea alkaliphila]
MFDYQDVIGHEDVLLHMRNAVKRNKVSHAYLFAGEEGSGKTLLSQVFAKVLLCAEEQEEPCNGCSSCILFNAGNHPDLVHVRATNKTSMGVEDVRVQVQEELHLLPYQSRYKIYLLHGADQMTIQAQNALLKTLEEPPEYAMFFLLAENPGNFLPTILSRCVLLHVKPVPHALVDHYIRTVLKKPDYQARLLTAFSRGNIGRAIQLSSSQAFLEARESVMGLMEVFIKGNEYDIIEAAGGLDQYKGDFHTVMELFQTWLRDLLVVKEVGDSAYLVHQDQYQVLQRQGMHLSYGRIGKLLENLDLLQQQIRFNVNLTLALEMMFLNAMHV